jgi:hypothetical protein
MNRVNTQPQNPDPSTPEYDYDNSDPRPGDTGVSVQPTFKLEWSKPMAPQWDINLTSTQEGCPSYDGAYFEQVNYLESENAFVLQFKEGSSLGPNCAYTLEVVTCSKLDGFRDPFGVIGECPGPTVSFTTGDS